MSRSTAGLVARARRVVRVVRDDPRDARERVVVRSLMRALTLRNQVSRRPVTGSGRAVVSLTTYGARARRVHLAVESIAAGRVRPSRLILWVDDPAILADLPVELRRLQARGLEILPCPDYGPHKKQYPYAASSLVHELPLVTADDDMLYPRTWLADLLAAYQASPGVVTGFRAHTLAVESDRIAAYARWTPRRGTEPSFRVFLTGCAGTVYPPALLEALNREGTAFMDLCPRADDVWVHAVAVRHGFPSRQIREHQVHFHSIPGTQIGTLQRANVKEGGNDRQIAQTYGPAEVAAILSAPA